MNHLSLVFLIISLVCYGFILAFYLFLMMIKIADAVSGFIVKDCTNKREIVRIQQIDGERILTGNEVPIGNGWYAVYENEK